MPVSMVAIQLPLFSAFCTSPFSLMLTKRVAARDRMMPRAPMRMGSSMGAMLAGFPGACISLPSTMAARIVAT